MGIPGAGKSTWAKRNLHENDVYISRDEIRFSMLKDGEDYFSHENKVYNEFIKAIQKALDKGGNIYVDATHLNWASRNKLFNRLNLNNVKVGCICFYTPLEICIKRNEKRTGYEKVPEGAIKRMYNSLRPPQNDPFTYDKIIEIKG